MSHRQDILTILKQVEGWPTEDRVALATELVRASSSTTLLRPRRTYERAKAIAKSIKNPPTDGQIDEMILKHRMSRFGAK